MAHAIFVCQTSDMSIEYTQKDVWIQTNKYIDLRK